MVWSAYPIAERIVKPSATQPHAEAEPERGVGVGCASAKETQHFVCRSIPAVLQTIADRCLTHRRIPIGLPKHLCESLGHLLPARVEREAEARVPGVDDATHRGRDDRDAEAKVLERRKPGRFDSGEQTAEMKASDDLDEALELAALVNVSKRPQRRMGRNVARIGPDDDNLDLVSHAPEDRSGLEEKRSALSFPVDSDEAKP